MTEDRMNDYSEFLDTALVAARESEAVILKYYSGSIRTELKSDNSPVTAADREAEARIKQIVRKRFPGHGFLGEESGNLATTSDFEWIVDPIDGTKNFARKIPVFATQIALMEGGQVVVGVSNAPAMHELFFATKGGGARDSTGSRLRVSSTGALGAAHVSLGGLNHFASIARQEALLRFVNKSARSRAIGDAYAYHLLASGRLEAVVEAKIRFWDVAALSLIIEEAGGSITDIDGRPLNKNSTTVIASNGKIHDEIVATFGPRSHA